MLIDKRLYIGVGGVARSGKNTYCDIAETILKNSGYDVKQYSFANALKKELESFLKDACGVDVWTNDTNIKADIRELLVWYGTTWWRKRDPERWIRNVEKKINDDSPQIVIVSDVRYPNEADWIHNNNGYIIHITSFEYNSSGEKCILQPPNIVEQINDPVVKEKSDYQIEWQKLLTEDLTIDIRDNMYLKGKVFKSLQKCPGLNQLYQK